MASVLCRIARWEKGLAALAAALALGLLSHDAHAVGDPERRPTLLSDGFYLGARGEPGWALLAGWDLDVYPTADRAVSLGPAVTVTALSTDALSLRTQRVMVSVDAVRLKVGLNYPGGLFRPFALVGGGFLWTQFALRELPLATAPDESFAGHMVVGAGADIWGRRSFGVTVMSLTRIRVVGPERLPLAWFEASIGFRVGL
ncbi:MAG: hypothetical protein Q8Q09_27050 [Deltaproteobacteria bacterium]|nr:hypothetical protein [Deltaproteobacteria bacterium]